MPIPTQPARSGTPFRSPATPPRGRSRARSRVRTGKRPDTGLRIVQLLLWLSAALTLTLLSSEGVAGQAPGSGFVEWNGYRDTRDFSVSTSALGIGLTDRLAYFGFANHFGALDSGATDLSAFYAEQNLRLRLGGSPFDATAQWVTRSGEANDLLRFGLRWRLAATPGLSDLFRRLRLGWSINLHAVQLEHGDPDGFRTQIEHGYRWVLVPGDRELSLSGFLDHNLDFDDDDGSETSRIVTEHQLALRLLGDLHAVAELRWNQYMTGRSVGVGFGIQYRRAFGG